MNGARQRLAEVREIIHAAEQKYGRPPGAVRLLAVCKSRTAAEIRELAGAGLADFGENYVQEAFARMDALADIDLNWHFIGPIQSNKTRLIAERFSWVHSLDRVKIARRLSEARPENLAPLDVCIQVNISGEGTKSGVAPSEAAGLARSILPLPRLRLRGLMTLPAPAATLEDQRRPFRELRALLSELNREGLGLDTLSMGTTADLEAAVAEGATITRVGTGLFGPRPTRDR
jgi:pyridoxal phosphate enzyme (YggS family)